MASKKPVHTTTNPDGAGWVNQAGGEVLSHHRTQRTAVERGREIAIENKSEHVIHRPNGAIREKNSYGPDPKNRKG